MAVPSSNSQLVNTTGGAFTFAVEGGCILQNSAVTSGLGAVITKALSLKDGVSLAADSNTLPRVITGNGAYNASSQSLPSIANNAGSGITGDIYIENDSACVGTVILKCKKVSGFDNIT